MEKLSDCTKHNLLSLYPALLPSRDIKRIKTNEFVIVSFETTIERPRDDVIYCRGSSATLKRVASLISFFSGDLTSVSKEWLRSTSDVSNMVATLVTHHKYFDRVTEVFLGDSKSEAVEKCAALGVEAFLAGNFAEARRLFSAAQKNANFNRDEMGIYRNLFETATMAFDAVECLKKEQFKNYVIEMQHAHNNCDSKTMKAFIGKMRNSQAEKFSETARKYSDKGNLKESREFFELAKNLRAEVSDRDQRS